MLSRRAFVLGEDLHTQYWERPQRVLRSGTTLVGRAAVGGLLIGCSAVGGRSPSGFSAVWRREQGGLWPLAFSWTHGLHPFSRWLLLAAPGDYWHRVVGLWRGWVLRENRPQAGCALVCGGTGVVGSGRHGNRR